VVSSNLTGPLCISSFSPRAECVVVVPDIATRRPFVLLWALDLILGATQFCVPRRRFWLSPLICVKQGVTTSLVANRKVRAYVARMLL
jgi:hypothetical protein